VSRREVYDLLVHDVIGGVLYLDRLKVPAPT